MAKKPLKKKAAAKKPQSNQAEKERARELRKEAATARKKAEEEGMVVALPEPAPKEGDVKKPLTFELDELYQYKLQVLSRDLDDAKAKVSGPLRDIYQRELITKLNAAIAADPACQEAHRQRVECINTLLDGLSSQLPKGYAVAQINPDKGNITAEYDPDKADQRLSEVLK